MDGILFVENKSLEPFDIFLVNSSIYLNVIGTRKRASCQFGFTDPKTSLGLLVNRQSLQINCSTNH